jgi:aspartokinase/homoserine dehydrogenase 1
MKVLKFGGAALASVENMNKVIAVVESQSKNNQLFIVASATSGTTNRLIEAGILASDGNEEYKKIILEIEKRQFEFINGLFPLDKQSDIKLQSKQLINEIDDICKGIYLLKEIFPKTNDFLMSFGERLSGILLYNSLLQANIETIFIDAREVIITDDNFGQANVNFEKTNQAILEKTKNSSQNYFLSGFIASTIKGKATTLGRGGADFTASIVAAAVEAEILELWKDVDGVMTANPAIVSSAYPIEKLSYEEAMELSHFGAKVIYAPSINPAFRKEIPILIKNILHPEGKGTYISKEGTKNGKPVKGLSSVDKIALLTLSGGGMVGVTGVAARLFTALSNALVNVIFITQASSEHSISLAIAKDQEEIARKVVNKEFENEITLGKIKELEVEHHLSIVAIVGDNMKESVGLSGKTFNALGQNGVNVRAIAQGSTERNISIVINRVDVHKAMNVLHEQFFLSKTKKVHLFLVGVGNVGSALISQIEEQYEYLKAEHKLEIKIIAMANSRKMLFEHNGINLKTWKTDLMEKGETSSSEKFLEKMHYFNLRNSVFVDNTASEQIAELYSDILENSISVVASSKIAASSNYSSYVNMNQLARKKNIKLLYEANVGAGLPILKTIADMMKSGDKIIRIQAVLSGSLNFIFNHFQENTSFTSVVRQAVEQGYTEPDPRIDLSGLDVARKILILARESGFNLEMADISIQNFIPQEIMQKESISDFLSALKENDSYFNDLRQNAADKQKKLRYVADFNEGKASVGLIEADSSQPYYQLDGKDNIVLLYTKRYKEQPLVIKGAGAGSEVTASGVFADIISIVNQ